MATKLKPKTAKAKRTTKATKAKAVRTEDETKAAELESLKETVSNSHGKWIGNNPKATLGDLLSFLRDVQEEFFNFNDDDILADISGELGDAAVYLTEFEEFTKPIGPDKELPTVGYRAANVEEDIGVVEDLIEHVGEGFPMKKLCSWEQAMKKRLLVISGRISRTGNFQDVTAVRKTLKTALTLPFPVNEGQLHDFMKANPGKPCRVPAYLGKELFGLTPVV